MSVGNWNPETENVPGSTPDAGLIRRFIELGNQQPEAVLHKVFSADEIKNYASTIQLDRQQWLPLTENLGTEEIIALIRFFTLAEEQLSGWEALDKSAVIPLNKILKQRGGRLGPDMLIWIRQNSRNRYLPNGAVM